MKSALEVVNSLLDFAALIISGLIILVVLLQSEKLFTAAVRFAFSIFAAVLLALTLGCFNVPKTIITISSFAAVPLTFAYLFFAPLLKRQ